MFFRFNSISHYYKRTFGTDIQKISIDAGFTCPNRDGTKGIGGCTYCNNEAFVPSYCSPKKSISQQIEEGIKFFAKKHKNALYLAYFQAYSNTYAPLEVLKKKYEEALKHPKIIGLIISTRPDCVDDEKLDYLAKISQNYYIKIEYGLESFNNEVLKTINRQHTVEDSLKAIEMSAKRNLLIGVHLIMGLPGDNRNFLLKTADYVSKLPIKFLKLHQLQILRKTKMAFDYQQNPGKYHLFETADEYLHFLVKYIERLNPSIVLERFTSESPENMLIAPKWGKIKNYQLVHKFNKLLQEKNTWQGKFFN